MNSKDGIDFAMFFTLETPRNAGGLQILRCQGFEVKYYDFARDALTLKPSDVCNVGVKSAIAEGTETGSKRIYNLKKGGNHELKSD